VFPGILGRHLRPSVRARLPPRPGRGNARRHLPGSSASPPISRTTSRVACRRVLPKKRQAHRDRRRRNPLHSRSRAISPRSAITAPCSIPTPKAGGMMADANSEIPPARFRHRRGKPITSSISASKFKGGHRIDSLKKLLAEKLRRGLFVGSRRAAAAASLKIPGRKESFRQCSHRPSEWLARRVVRPRRKNRQRRVIVLGGGNTAMDCWPHRRAVSAAKTSRWSCVPASRK